MEHPMKYLLIGGVAAASIFGWRLLQNSVQVTSATYRDSAWAAPDRPIGGALTYGLPALLAAGTAYALTRNCKC